MVDCPYGKCEKFKSASQDPFFMTRVDILDAIAPNVYAVANFTLNLPFIVSGSIPKVVLDVNSGDDLFCVVEIEAMTLPDKGDEANPNIPTFAFVNLTVADMSTFRDKMAAMTSFDDMELWVSGSRTVGLDSDYFFSLVSTMAVGFDIPVTSPVNATLTAEAAASSAAKDAVDVAAAAAANGTYPTPYVSVQVVSEPDYLVASIRTLLSPSLFPVPVAIGMRDLNFNLRDRHGSSALGFAVHGDAVMKAFCEFNLDPSYCTPGGDNYVNASLAVTSRQEGEALNAIIANATEGSVDKESPISFTGDVTYPDHWWKVEYLVARSTVLEHCDSELSSFCLSPHSKVAALECLTSPEVLPFITRPFCLRSLTPKGSINLKVDDMWDIPFMLQMGEFSKKTKQPYVPCSAPCPFVDLGHWYFADEFSPHNSPTGGLPAPAPSAEPVGPPPPFALTSFTFNHFRSGSAPLDMDCIYESFEGLRLFKNSHCNGANSTSIDASVGAEAFLGMKGMLGTDLDVTLNKATAIIQYTNTSEAAERLRPSLISRIKVVDGIIKDNTVGGLGGGVKNVSINVPDLARFAEFASNNHREAVKLYFEPEGDLLSKILSLPAFTLTLEPSNSSFAYLADLETAVEFPVVVCMKSEECFILTGTEFRMTDDTSGGQMDTENFAFIYPGKSVIVTGEGYSSKVSTGDDGSSVSATTMYAKVAARKRANTDEVSYDERSDSGLGIQCAAFVPRGSNDMYDLSVTYDFPDTSVSSCGIYDILMVISNTTDRCGQSATGFEGDLIGQIAVVKPINEDYGGDDSSSDGGSGGDGEPDDGEPDEGGDEDGGVAPSPSQQNSTRYRPLSTFSIELNSTENTVGLFNSMKFDKSFDASYKLMVPAVDLKFQNIPLSGVQPEPPTESDKWENAMLHCQTTGEECDIASISQTELYVDKGDSRDTSGVIKAIVGTGGNTDLFNQVTNEGLAGKPVGIALKGTVGGEPFLLDFVPFRIPKSVREFDDQQQANQGSTRRMLASAVKAITDRSSRRSLTGEISEDDIFDAGSGFDRIDPWLRNTTIYRKSQFDLKGIEFLRASTLNTTFDTHWSDSDKPFKLYIESLLNFSTDLFQELFAVELTLPDVNFMASLEIEAVPGWNSSDSDTWYFGSIDSSGLPMTQFAELVCKGGTWSTADSFAEFQQSWMMINNTLLQRGLGEFVSRNQNITIRGQGARKSDSLLDRMLNYVRFDYTFPAKAFNVSERNFMGLLPETPLPQMTGGVKMTEFTVNTLNTNQATNSRTIDTGDTLLKLGGDFVREGEACVKCSVQVHVGFVKIGESVAATDFHCAYSGNPDEANAVSYSFDKNVNAPMEKGDYYVVFLTMFDYACGQTFEVGKKGTRVSGKRVGTLRVKNSGVGGQRRATEKALGEKCSSTLGLPVSKSNSSGLYCTTEGDKWVVYSNDQAPAVKPRPPTRRRLDAAYTGNEGLRFVGGLYSEADFIELNSTVEVWPHIYAQVPVDFKMGAIHLDIIDKARGTTMLEFDLDQVLLPAQVGGRVKFALKANKEENEEAITEFVQDLFDATIDSRELDVLVDGYIDTSFGRKKIDLGITISQAPGRGYFDIQEEGTRRVLRRLLLGKVREALGVDIIDLEQNVEPVLQHDGPVGWLRSVGRMLEEDEAADKEKSPYGGSVAKIDIIGGSEIGSTVTLPCVVESVCPPLSEASFSSATDLLLMTEYWLVVPGGLEVHFHTPTISLDVDCCVHTKLMSLTLLSDTISNADLEKPLIGVTKLEIDDASLMYQSFTSIGTTFAPVYRIHGNPNANMLSKVVSTVEFKYDMTPKDGKKMMCLDDTWVTYNELECFKMFTTAKNHADAEAYCEGLGDGAGKGHLLHIVNEEENAWIKETFYTSGGTNPPAWIGLDDLLQPDTWRWSDGTSGGYTNWAESPGTGDCAKVNTDGTWSAADCSTMSAFICEVDSIPWLDPSVGTPSPAATVAPSPAPTGLADVCEPLTLRSGVDTQINNKNTWDTFFFPTKCQGSWSLVDTDSKNAYLEVRWPGMELPVQVLLPTCSITLTYEGIEVGTITPGTSGDLELQKEGTTSYLKAHIYGDESLKNVICMNNDYVIDKEKCQLAKLIDTLLKGAMENGEPLDLGIVITYDHPLAEYSTQTIKMDISLFQKEATLRPQPGAPTASTIVDPTRAPSPAGSYCNEQFDQFPNVKREEYYGDCCDECYNEFSSIYSDISVDTGNTVWNSLDVLWNGATVFLSVEICNVFPFDLQATRIVADAAFDDPDGCQFGSFLGGNFDPKDDVIIATGVSWYPETPFMIPGGECKKTPSIPIDVPVTTEIVYRIADEAVYKSRLCLSIKNMVLDAGIVGPSNEAFSWTQPLDLSKISVIGTNDCVAAPDCNNEISPKVQQNFQSNLWQLNGQIQIQDSGNMRLTKGDGQEQNSAFLLQKYSMTDDWTVDATIQHSSSGRSCWTGGCSNWGSFGFVFQQDSQTKKGTGDYAFSGYGAESLGVIFDEPWNPTTTKSAKIFKGGNVADGSELSTSWDVDLLDSGAVNAFRVSYNAYSKVLQMWCNPGSDIDLNVLPKITLQIDLNTIFTKESGYAWVGFSSAIGSATIRPSSSVFKAKSYKFSGVRTVLSKTQIEEDGLVLGKQGTFVVDARASCGTYRFSGGDLWEFKLKNPVAGTEVSIPDSNVVDMNTGQYTVSYNVGSVSGSWQVWAKLTNDGGSTDQGEVKIGDFVVSA